MSWAAVREGFVSPAALGVLLCVLSSVSASAAAGSTSRTLAYGDWTTPEKISEEEMRFTEVSAFGIYQYGSANMTYSDDWGTSWSAEEAMGGRIDVAGNTIYRVRNIGDFPFDKSTDNGTTWSTPVNTRLSVDNDDCYWIQMLNGTLFVFNYDNYSKIQLKRSADQGVTWSSAVNVCMIYWYVPEPNSVVYLNGTLYLAYSDAVYRPATDDFAYEVRTVESHDMGLTWVNTKVVGSGLGPVIRQDLGTLYLSYIGVLDEYSGMIGVNFTKSSDEGATWSPAVVLDTMTAIAPVSLLHSLTASTGRIASSYVEYAPGPPEAYLVRIVLSEDDGVTWRDLGEVTNPLNSAVMPSVAIVVDTLHFFWVDLGPGEPAGGPYPTYYRSMDLSNPPPIPEFGAIAVPILGTLVLALATVWQRGRERHARH